MAVLNRGNHMYLRYQHFVDLNIALNIFKDSNNNKKYLTNGKYKNIVTKVNYIDIYIYTNIHQILI